MIVKDVMTPISECATVSEDRTVYESILMLEATRQRVMRRDYRPRVLLVHDRNFRVVGSVRHADMLRAFAGLPLPTGTCESAPESFEFQVNACRTAFGDLFETVRQVRITEVMRVPSPEEFISSDASIEEAACRVIAGPYLHLFVKSDDEIIGILRMSDLFFTLCEEVKKSGM